MGIPLWPPERVDTHLALLYITQITYGEEKYEINPLIDDEHN